MTFEPYRLEALQSATELREDSRHCNVQVAVGTAEILPVASREVQDSPFLPHNQRFQDYQGEEKTPEGETGEL